MPIIDVMALINSYFNELIGLHILYLVVYIGDQSHWPKAWILSALVLG
jgi:hypothetical protein